MAFVFGATELAKTDLPPRLDTPAVAPAVRVAKRLAGLVPVPAPAGVPPPVEPPVLPPVEPPVPPPVEPPPVPLPRCPRPPVTLPGPGEVSLIVPEPPPLAPVEPPVEPPGETVDPGAGLGDGGGGLPAGAPPSGGGACGVGEEGGGWLGMPVPGPVQAHARLVPTTVRPKMARTERKARRATLLNVIHPHARRVALNGEHCRELDSSA